MENDNKNKPIQKETYIVLPNDLTESAPYVSISIQKNIIRKISFWVASLAFLIIFLVAFSSILPPFIFGMLLAYFLNPIIQFMQKFGVSRVWGTTIITTFVLFLFVLLITVFIPIISVELQQFIGKALPIYLEKLQFLLAQHNFEWIERYLGSDPRALHSNLEGVLSYSSEFLKSILNSLLSSGKVVVQFISFFIVAPVVAFYLLLDWERMVASVDSWIPRDYLATIRGLCYEMDRTVAGYIRGQGTVCLLLAIYYSVSLTIIDLNYSLLLGSVIGAITFIPYFGSMIGFLCTIWVAWIQFSDSWMLLIVVIIFLMGQFLEGYILQPKLVGSSVGLHPVWLIFALFAFGSLFGFTGMLVAIPAAAALGTLVRFVLYSYLDSPLYEGQQQEKINPELKRMNGK